MKAYDIVVVGAGIAGLQAVEQIRDILPQSTVALFNEEDSLPYKRTKLSKNIATGFYKDQFALHDEQWYKEKNIDLFNSHKVISIDQDANTLRTEKGDLFSWKRLVLCTGAASCVPGDYKDAPYYQVYFSADALKLSEKTPGKALVLGLGVLGVETADQLWKKGHRVTIAGLDSRLMVKQLNETAAQHLLTRMQEKGIDVRFSVIIDHSEGFDSLTLCTGAIPRCEIEMDLSFEGALLVDEYMCTSHPCIFAGGDGVRMKDGYQSHLWHAAEHSGRAAGANAALSLKGERLEAYHPRPWRLKCEVFDQYYFSINYSPDQDESQFEIVEQQTGDIYRCFRFSEGKIHSIIMINEKERAKWYQQAVQQAMTREEFMRQISQNI